MKPILLLLFAGTAFVSVQAQQSTPYIVASGGDFFTGSNFTNSITIGEMAMVETFAPGGFMLTQGFQQPEYGPTAVVSGTLNGSFLCYPNPSSGAVTLAFNFSGSSSVRYELFDLPGKNIMSGTTEVFTGSRQQQLDLSAFSSGTYFLRCIISSDGKETATTTRISLVK